MDFYQFVYGFPRERGGGAREEPERDKKSPYIIYERHLSMYSAFNQNEKRIKKVIVYFLLLLLGFSL